MSVDQLVFWVFAPLSVGAAVLMLLQRNAVHSALFLIVNFFCLSVFFLVLGSPFLFVVQIVVYAGAAGLVLPATSSRAEITEALQRLKAGGSTAGAQAPLRPALWREGRRGEGVGSFLIVLDSHEARELGCSTEQPDYCPLASVGPQDAAQ